jgi:hypothetical protein
MRIGATNHQAGTNEADIAIGIQGLGQIVIIGTIRFQLGFATPNNDLATKYRGAFSADIRLVSLQMGLVTFQFRNIGYDGISPGIT